MANIVTDQTFDQLVLKNAKPVLVDFWAEWCGPCRMQNPILEEVAQALGDAAVIVKHNVDEQPEKPQSYGVMSIPTMMIFKNGQMVKQYVGVQSKETLVDELKKHAN